ncbi:hypothetical protein CLIB1423_15S02344 [[Candida] railenensis]|uniref:Uncharacterized protein n=1 Tax=[Candida] railenensis TaxID=45579 RepID=A0A9P0QST2_9ASCO|nr:hypothetical protein CLIB1423_15S02344 [[Candida] railenensis]
MPTVFIFPVNINIHVYWTPSLASVDPDSEGKPEKKGKLRTPALFRERSTVGEFSKLFFFSTFSFFSLAICFLFFYFYFCFVFLASSSHIRNKMETHYTLKIAPVKCQTLKHDLSQALCHTPRTTPKHPRNSPITYKPSLRPSPSLVPLPFQVFGRAVFRVALNRKRDTKT